MLVWMQHSLTLLRRVLALSAPPLALYAPGMPATYRPAEIARLAGITPRTLRYYIELGLLPGPEQRGVQTVYTHAQLVRLQAIPLLRKRERLRLPMVKRRLAAMSAAEIEALVTPPKPPAPTSPLLAAPPYPCVRWDYVELLPGLELRVRSNSGPVLRRLAQEIHAHYGAAAPEEAVGAQGGAEPVMESAKAGI
jgi:DNA-binding transcriptional MerR regulator